MKANLLELGDLAEVCDAGGKVGEGAVPNDEREVVLVHKVDKLECERRYTLRLNLARSREDREHCPPTGSQVLVSRLQHLLQALQHLHKVSLGPRPRNEDLPFPRIEVLVVQHGVLEGA